MNDISVVMITMDREVEGKENYLPSTLDSLRSSGVFLSPRLHSFNLCVSRSQTWPKLSDYISDAEAETIQNAIPLVVHYGDRLACENAGHALQTGARSGASWVLFCEDDIIVCADFLGSVGRWLDEYADDDRYIVYSFGTPYDDVKKVNPFTGNSWQYPVTSFYGTQCFVLRPEHALSLGTYISSNPIVRGVTNPNAYDLMFHDWMRENYPTKTFLASVPSFVQHVGRQSICTGKDKTHTFDSFPGTEWSYPPFESGYQDGIKSLIELYQSDDRKPRILYVGDAVVSTGFSRCTHAVCDYLSTHGYDVTVLGMSYHGDPHSYSYPIYPAISPIDQCTDYGGAARLPLIMDRVKPDLIVIQQDPWNIPAYLDYIRYAFDVATEKDISFNIPPIIGFLAVDAKNHKGYRLEDLNHIVTWTEFGRNEIINGGYTGPTSVVPLGVDTSIYYPRDKGESRSKVCSDSRIPDNAYIVGCVGRNQHRKRLDLTIEYFAEWVKLDKIDNAYLYLYTGSSGEKSVDIESLVSYYGIRGRVIVNTPPTGYGNPEMILPYVYSSFDVYLSTSMAEGFCLPVLEAMACGIPCIVPDSGGFEWTGNVAMRVKCETSAMVAPLNGQQYTIGTIPDKRGIISALSNSYRYLKGVQHDGMVRRGLDLASHLSWKRTGELFEKVVEKVFNRNRPATRIEQALDSLTFNDNPKIPDQAVFISSDRADSHDAERLDMLMDRHQS